MKKSAIKLTLSVIMLVFTAAALVVGAVAWFASNYNVGGNSGNIGIAYDQNGGSADFVPGDGFGGENPDMLVPGDRAEFKFALKNTSDAAKNYVFYIKSLSVVYPTAEVKNKAEYSHIANADNYEYYDAASVAWIKYNGLRDATDAEKTTFYEKFVTSITNTLKVAVVPADGTTVDDAIAVNADKMAYMTEVDSYYDAHGNTSFYGQTDVFVVDGTADAPKINDKLAANFPLTVAAGETGYYRLLLLCDGDIYPTATVNGTKYRMTNSNAFMWQSVFATVVVKEV